MVQGYLGIEGNADDAVWDEMTLTAADLAAMARSAPN
jgi:hypothetical protein